MELYTKAVILLRRRMREKGLQDMFLKAMWHRSAERRLTIAEATKVLEILAKLKSEKLK